MRAVLVIGLAAAVAAVILRPGSPGPGPPAAITPPEHAANVTTVYDGDTVEAHGVGKIRLLGVDAMDGHNLEKRRHQAAWYGMTERQVSVWAERATAFARDALQGRRVQLSYGGELLDDYGRTLAYVHVAGRDGEEGADFGLLLLERGLAAAYRRYSHPRRQQYLDAERRARANRIGLWKDARRVP